MRASAIEGWALTILDRVEAGVRNEDDRVELKREWPKASTGARRIAAHANAARGESILWLIGVDEKNGDIVQLPTIEPADWWAAIEAEFDGPTPSLSVINVQARNGPVVALYFETDRAPFVVRNPAYGTSGGGSVSLEVPWREGTAARSASRADLLRILVPRQRVPDITLMNAYVTNSLFDQETPGSLPGGEPRLHWSIYATMYVTPRSAERLVFPFHLAEIELTAIGASQVYRPPVTRLGPQSMPGRSGLSATVVGTGAEAIVDGPGILALSSTFETALDWPEAESVKLTIRLTPVLFDAALVVEGVLAHQKDETVHRGRTWRLKVLPPRKRSSSGDVLPTTVVGESGHSAR